MQYNIDIISLIYTLLEYFPCSLNHLDKSHQTDKTTDLMPTKGTMGYRFEGENMHKHKYAKEQLVHHNCIVESKALKYNEEIQTTLTTNFLARVSSRCISLLDRASVLWRYLTTDIVNFQTGKHLKKNKHKLMQYLKNKFLYDSNSIYSKWIKFLWTICVETSCCSDNIIDQW